MDILINENDARAEKLITAAIVKGELKEFYEKNKTYLSGYSRKVLSSYFSESPIDNITNEDLEIVEDIILEISDDLSTPIPVSEYNRDNDKYWLSKYVYFKRDLELKNNSKNI